MSPALRQQAKTMKNKNSNQQRIRNQAIKILRRGFVQPPDILPKISEKKRISETLSEFFSMAEFMADACYDYQQVVLNFVNGNDDQREWAISVLQEAKETFRAHFCADVDFLITCLKALPAADESNSGNNFKEGSEQGEHSV